MSKTKINEPESAARIVVVGVDGTGNNAVSHTIDENVAGVEFIGTNTDRQILQFRKVPTAMQTGEKLTKGLGAGARLEVGKKAAEESSEEISQASKSVDMVSITCGIGGGAGVGAAPVVAKTAKDMGIPIVGVVTKPSRFKAKTRMGNALSGIEQLKNSVGTLIVISNDRLLEVVDRCIIMLNALKKADEVLRQVVQGITDLVNAPGLINLDLTDVQAIMIGKGIAHTGVGKTKGDDRATKAVEQAVSSPLLETTIKDASHITISISGDISLTEVNKAASYVQELVDDEVNIIFGAMPDENVQDEATITVIAIGLDERGASASMAKVMIGFTSSKTRVPAVGAPAGQQAYVAVPETAVAASAPYTSRPASQGCMTHGCNPAGGDQGYATPKYSPNQEYASGSQNSDPNSATIPNRPFRPAADKKMQINTLDFPKNKR